MTLRDVTGVLAGLGSLLVLGSCAQASPPLADRTATLDGAGSAGYQLQVLVNGMPAATFTQGGGAYVLGEQGQRYTLRVLNHTGRRIEAVVSVDGRDAVDGRPADFRSKRGYLVPAWGQIDIDGWRLSTTQAAAFRFTTVADSYAARTGSAREVGVIGAAIFPERFIPRPPPPRPLELAPPSASRAPSSMDDLGSSGGRADKSTSAAPSARAEGASAPERRRGLGTEFGEAVSSPVEEVTFLRASATRPAAILGLRYNDRDGLVAMGIDVDACAAGPACDHEAALRQTALPFPADRSARRFAAPPPCWNSGAACRSYR